MSWTHFVQCSLCLRRKRHEEEGEEEDGKIKGQTSISNTVAHATIFKPDAEPRGRTGKKDVKRREVRAARGARGRNVVRVRAARGNGSLGDVRSDQRLETVSASASVCECVCVWVIQMCKVWTFTFSCSQNSKMVQKGKYLKLWLPEKGVMNLFLDKDGVSFQTV